jgi:predicted thioesterase
MQNPFKPEDVKVYSHVVAADDVAAFESGHVHSVYSTFALARDAEWSGRLFVLEMKEADEEGIGTGINISHQSPALIGEEVVFTATLVNIERNEVITDFIAKVGARTIATGRQWQKIVKKEKLEKLFNSLA